MAYIAEHVGIKDLEQLVESKLAQPLQRISDGSRCPAFDQSNGTFLLDRHREARPDTLVLLGIHLKNNFRENRRDC